MGNDGAFPGDVGVDFAIAVSEEVICLKVALASESEQQVMSRDGYQVD